MNEVAVRFEPRLIDRVSPFLALAGVLTLVWIPFPVGAAALVALMAGTVALIWPVTIPIALILSVPVQDVVQIPVAGFGITLTQLLVAGTLVGFPIVLLVRSSRVHFPAVAVALTAYLLVQIASLTVAANVLYGIATIFRWSTALLAFLVVIHLMANRKAATLLSYGLFLAAVAEVGFGTVQAALGLAPPSFAVAAGLYRAYGTFGQPNPFAGYLEMTGFWLAALSLWFLRYAIVLSRRYRRTRLRGFMASASTRRTLVVVSMTAVLFGFGALVSLVGIVLSFSRGAWVGTLAGLGTLVLLGPRVVRRLAVAAAFVLLAFLLAGGWDTLPAAVRERTQQLITQAGPFDVRDVQLTGGNWAVVERMVHWQAAWDMFLDHPWTGVGAGNFSVAFPDYSHHPLFRIARGHAHNYYLHVLAELGIPGFVSYGAVLALGVVMIVRVLRCNRSSFDRSLALGTLAATTAVLVHNLVENLHELHLSIQLFSLWALTWRASMRWIDTGSRRWIR
ncbi:MAG: O-antigen ligase family protein [Thermomicrobium sp.]|nr:O-antigen ligase family protein [Thermomicrobium sp.]